MAALDSFGGWGRVAEGEGLFLGGGRAGGNARAPEG